MNHAEADRQRWDERHRAGADRVPPVHPWLLELGEVVPRSGRALDAAGGTGRHALWLAARGLAVTLADLSPVALAIARERADAAGLPLTTTETDLERQPPPAGPWDLALVVDFLSRPLYQRLAGTLSPGGVLVIAHPTRTNLTRHEHPSARFLLDDGELEPLIAGLGLDVVRTCEGWAENRRHEARIAARRPVPRAAQ